jgi:membrane protease YdiL (CAAX protease family)
MGMKIYAARLAWVVVAGIVGYVIALAGQGIWSALVSANLAGSGSVPWSVPLMALILWPMWLYLDGRGWPHRLSEIRHRYLRANRVPARVFAWAFLAGALATAALGGLWIVMARLVRMPGNVLPDLSAYPPLTAALAVGMGAVISPLLEQAGFWGYCQVILEDRFSPAAAILITALIYSLGPHPGSVLVPRLIFYFLAGAIFGLLSYLTKSNLPGLLVHILGILAFFTLVWPEDPSRPQVSASGADAGFWLSVVAALIFAGLSFLAFRRLGKARDRN